MENTNEDNNQEIKKLLNDLKQKVCNALNHNEVENRNFEENVKEKEVEKPDSKIDMSQQSEPNGCSENVEKAINLSPHNQKDMSLDNVLSILKQSLNIEKNLNKNETVQLKDITNANRQTCEKFKLINNKSQLNDTGQEPFSNFFELITKEMDEFKSICQNMSFYSKKKPKCIKFKFEYKIDLKDEFLINYFMQKNLPEYLNPILVCEIFNDLIKKEKLSDSTMKEIFEILIQNIKFLDEKSIHLVESILEKENNYDSFIKYELISRLMNVFPNLSNKWMIIFIRNLENLVKSYNDDIIDIENEFENLINTKRNQKIKEILQMAKFSFFPVIDLDKINLLKRIWTNSKPGKLFKNSSFSA